MTEQHCIRFRCDEVSDKTWARIVEQTDVTDRRTARVDDGIATVCYRGPIPDVSMELEALGAIVRSPAGNVGWTTAEVQAATPAPKELL